MVFILMRVLFVIICTGTGYYSFQLNGAIIGLTGSLVIIGIEMSLRLISIKSVIMGSIGLIGGLVIGKLLTDSFLVPFLLEKSPIPEQSITLVRAGTSLIFGYIGFMITLKKKGEISLLTRLFTVGESKGKSEIKVLDTSVIIDGRIADICDSGFLEGPLVVPRFVLRELQGIADSADSLKRKRGRRGLDVLNRIQKNERIGVTIQDTDFPEVQEVDAKLVKLGKLLNAQILTNDYNLNKVAEIQQVGVLNINELANALKPVVLPGETMKVRIIKEGKEAEQGVGYLDDGTMVVVDSGKYYLNQVMEIMVTSVLQTPAGRMIFGRRSEGGENNQNRNRNKNYR